MIDLDELANTVDRYLDVQPDERRSLAPFLASLRDRGPITNRSTFSGHLTCSAVLVGSDQRVLHIRHNTLETWLRPGGHVEPDDTTPIAAALREVEEETGIPAGMPVPLNDGLPIDIDVHVIPANPSKGEPEHPHFDLRYAFTVPAESAVTLQTEEVNAFDWLPIDELEPQALRAKLRTMI